MKYVIQDGIYGNDDFPIPFDKILGLAHGVYGDFEKPYYHNALCVLWRDEESGREWYKTIGTFRRGKPCRRFWIFGEVTAGKLSGFETRYKEKDINYLIGHFKG